MKALPTWAIVVLVLVVVAVIAAVVVYAVIQRRRKAAAAAAAALPTGKQNLAAEIREAFVLTESKIRAKMPDETARSAIPRVLVVGEPGSGKTTLLGATLLGTPLVKATDPQPGDPAPVHLWTFDRGVVIDPKGEFFLTEKGDEPDPPAALNALVDELNKARPGRPIDAILLTIPCTDLYPRGDVGEDDRKRTDDDRKRRATILHKQIGDIQRKLGMRVPVYVIVTKCDVLPSFQSFGNEVGPAVRQGILGWSRPDQTGPIASARPQDAVVHDFVGEAMVSLEKRLASRQVTRFLTGKAAPVEPAKRLGAADGLFLFPTELRLIASALRIYVDEIFVPSVYDEPFELRGIYFCGDGGQGAVAAPSAAAPVTAPPGARGVLFVRKLFEDKIVPEANLARPSDGAEKSRSRLILALRIAALVTGLALGIGLTLELQRIRDNVAALVPTVRHIRDYLDLEKDRGDKPASAKEQRDQTLTLLDDFAAMRPSRLASPLIPVSWLGLTRGGIDARMEAATKVGYERVILSAFRARLAEKLSQLTVREPPMAQGRDAPLTPETSAEFVQLDRWIQRVAIFDRELSRYNRLATKAKGSGDGGELTEAEERRESEARIGCVAELAEYLLEYKKEPGFYADARYYRLVLAHGGDLSKFTIDPDRQNEVTTKANELFGKLLDMLQLRKDQLVREDLRELAHALDLFEAGGADYSVRQLRDLRRSITITESDLGEPLLAWVPNKVPPENQGLERLLEVVEKSPLLGPERMRFIQQQNEQRMDEFLKDVEGAQSVLTGPLLKRKGKNLQMTLSDEVAALKKPLDDLLAERFMAAADDLGLPALDESMTWDIEQLKEAATLVKEHDTFVEAGHFKLLRGVTQETSQAAQRTATELAERQLRVGVVNRIRSAAKHERTEQVRGGAAADRTRGDVENIRLATPPLREVLGAFIRFHMNEDRDQLRAIIRTQGSRLLRDAYNVLLSRRLYEVAGGSFRWWKSTVTPAYEAFEVTDAAGLAEYVADQRAEANKIANEFAVPVLALLQSLEVGASMSPVVGMPEWAGVIEPLRDYEAKKPGNSVSALERFLITDLPAIKLDNCLSLKQLTGRAKDFFAARRLSIIQLLRKQCQVRSGETIEAQYFRLWDQFTRQLAGRFPFAKADPKARIDDAPPEAVRDFCAKVGDFTKVYREEIGVRAVRDADAARVARFLDDMEKVRAFLEPMWLQADSAADGAFDVKVDFRANPQHEIGGNQIAEWVMLFPEDRLSLGGAKPVAHWRIGDGVRLALRWAKNSPDIPTIQQDNGAAVRDRVATFETRGTWALLHLINAYQTTVRDPAGAVDPSANYLMFRVQTAPDPGGGFLDRVGADSGTARVFIRLVVSGADKKKLPRYPDFPVLAPAL